MGVGEVWLSGPGLGENHEKEKKRVRLRMELSGGEARE